MGYGIRTTSFVKVLNRRHTSLGRLRLLQSPTPYALPSTSGLHICRRLAILSRYGLVMFWPQGRTLYRRPTTRTAPTSAIWQTSDSHNRPVEHREKAASARPFGCFPDSVSTTSPTLSSCFLTLLSSARKYTSEHEPWFLAISRMSFERNMCDVCIRVEQRECAAPYTEAQVAAVQGYGSRGITCNLRRALVSGWFCRRSVLVEG